MDLVDILEHERGTTLERQADVFSLDRVGVSGSRGVELVMCTIKSDRKQHQLFFFFAIL